MSKVVTVDISNFVYQTDPVEIEVGDSVQWTNRDNMGHTATREEVPAFDTGVLRRNTTSAPVLFTNVSDDDGFKYHCTPHPAMHGRIIVREARRISRELSPEG